MSFDEKDRFHGCEHCHFSLGEGAMKKPETFEEFFKILRTEVLSDSFGLPIPVESKARELWDAMREDVKP